MNLKDHIKFSKNKELFTILKNNVGVSFVPFTVVLENKNVLKFHVGYVDSLWN